MSKHLISVMTTVNAPYSNQLSGGDLAHCLSDVKWAKQFSGQVSSFLGEVSVDHQLEFAGEYGISPIQLKSFASAFSAWSGESYKLVE